MTSAEVPPNDNDSAGASAFSARFAQTFRERGWREASPLIEEHWDEFALTNPELLLDAIKTLPSEAFMENPTWLIGVSYLQHLVAGTDPRSFRRTFNMAPAMPSGELALRERLIGLTGRIAELRTAGRLSEAVALAKEARRALLAAPSEEFAYLRSTLPHLTVQWARAMDIGDDPGAFEIYEDTYETSLLSDQPRVARRAAASLAWMYADHGHGSEARRWLDRGNAIHVQTDRYDIPLFLAAALLAADALEPVEAQQQLNTAGQYPVGEYWAASLYVRSLVDRSADGAAAVEGDLVRDVRRHPEGLVNSGANSRYVAQTRWLLYARRRASGAATESAPRASGSTLDLIAAEVAYRKGLFSEASRRCAPVLATSTAPRLRAAALLITAASRFRLGRSGSGVELFRQAHALVEHESLLLTFLVIDSADLVELARLSERRLRASVLRAIDERRESTRPSIPPLTRREQQVLALLASDMSNTEIAESLFVTMNTLKSTLRHVYRKLGVHDRQKASDIAHQLGIERTQA